MRVLVTGGAGFLGSHLVDRLIKEGHKVTVVDNLSGGKRENLNPKAKFYKIDICSLRISQILEKEKPEIVYHLAAKINVRKSLENPADDAKTNILGTLNLLKNCKKYKVRKFIFPSSAGVYGEAKNLPTKENYPLNPIAPYSIGKLAIEKYLSFYQTRGLPFVALRYSNIYGPRQSGSGEGGAVAVFIDKILKGAKPVVFGNGNQTRDFLYIEDAIEAAILAPKAKSGSVYNVGINKVITINDLLKLISRILNKKVKPVFKPLRQGEIIHSRIDYSKIKRELKWSPRYGLEKGLKKTIDWFKEN